MTLLQIYEYDLETLERELPALMDRSLLTCNDPLVRKQWEAVQTVLTRVRWRYGPPSNVSVQSCEDDSFDS